MNKELAVGRDPSKGLYSTLNISHVYLECQPHFTSHALYISLIFCALWNKNAELIMVYVAKMLCNSLHSARGQKTELYGCLVFTAQGSLVFGWYRLTRALSGFQCSPLSIM